MRRRAAASVPRGSPPVEIARIFALRLDGYGDEGATRQIGVRALAG
jgi:hypothetical protein